MSQFLRNLILLTFLLIPTTFCLFDGRDFWSSECTKQQNTQGDMCKFWHNIKVRAHLKGITENPENSKNITLTKLKMHCDNRFVCLENTYCYKDSYNYQLLDECIEEVFQIGPMSFCVKKLRDVLNSEPKKLSKCVKDYLEKNATSTTDCLVIKNTGDCLLPDVQKHCDPKFLAMYKQYLSLRLYNLACDGRLRYRVPGDEPQNVLNPTNSTEQIEEN